MGEGPKDDEFHRNVSYTLYGSRKVTIVLKMADLKF